MNPALRAGMPPVLARCLRPAVMGALWGERSGKEFAGMSDVDVEWGDGSGCLSDVSCACALDTDPSFPDLDLRFLPTWLRVVSLPW